MARATAHLARSRPGQQDRRARRWLRWSPGCSLLASCRPWT